MKFLLKLKNSLRNVLGVCMRISRLLTQELVLIGVLLLSACASTSTEKVNEVDPHENFNRTMYSVNEGINNYVARPIVKGYQWFFPHFLQTGVANFFTNLKEPRTVVNDVLQGKEKQTGNDLERFVINTLFGLGGIVNVASYANIEYHEEDFAQTLAIWGVPRGDYLVLPMVGPTSYRALPGQLVDTASNPVNYAIWPIQVLGIVNSTSSAEDALNIIDEVAVDPYIFMRTSYLQWRDHQITEGQIMPNNLLLLDMGDEDEEDMELLEEDLDVNL